MKKASDNLIVLLLIVASTCNSLVLGTSCINVTELSHISDLYWEPHNYQGQHDPVTFNLCKDSTTDVDIKFSNDSKVIGNKYVTSSSTDFKEVMLEFDGTDGAKTFLYFSCDKSTLGKPLLLDKIGNTYYFEWKSLIACHGSALDDVHQVPCYVYESSGQLHDISGLTNITEPYSVTASDGKKLEFNVCRKVTGGQGSCSAGACILDGTTVSKSYVITPTTALTYHNSDKSVNMEYADSLCKVSLKFLCPTSPSESAPPKATAQGDCSYVVEWYTTHACASNDLKLDNTCKLVSSQYGLSLDLSPLSNNGVPFSLTHDDYQFKIGLCGTEVPDCPLPGSDNTRGKPVSCQLKPQDQTFHKNLGMSEFRQLGYNDDVLYMKLAKGEPCSNNYARETIINFHCDETAGIGAPEWVGEAECSYQFDWHTVYACNQDMSRQCKYTSTSGTVYDFSSLTASPDSTGWLTSFNDTATAYINVCQPIGSDKGCDATAAVCVRNNGKDHSDTFQGSNNLGMTSTMKFDEDSNGLLSLTYESGAVCQGEEKHKSIIYFSCSTQSSSEGPHMQTEASTKCVHKFMWFTSAACGQNTDTTPTNATSCKVTATDGYVYDFSSIKDLVDVVDGDFKLNPCSALTNSSCGADAHVCDGAKVLSKTNPSLQIRSEQLITSTFNGSGADQQVIVQFNCNHNAEVANITGITRLVSSITVNVDTTLSCAPKDIDCKPVDDKGNNYDISGLKGVYETDLDKGMSYYFSVCGPLDLKDSRTKNCAGNGPISACQRTSGGKDFVNLGYAHSNPQVVSEGIIHLHYVNGQRCGHGNQTPRQTTIVLNCAQEESRPVVKPEDSNCNYEIWYDTPAACPIKNSTTQGCSVTQDGVKYDLSSLKTTQTVTKDGKDYYVSICDKVTGTGDPCKDSSVCMKTGSTYTNVGNLAGYSLTKDTNQIEIEYSAGSATKSFIYFQCSAEGDQKVEFLRKNEGTPTVYYFLYNTPLACEGVESVPCTVSSDDGKTFDLSPLTRHSGNFLAEKDSSGENFYVNVCHRVVADGDAANCPRGSAGCMKKNGKYVSLGQLAEAQSPLRLFGDALSIHYTNGDSCPDEDNSNYSMMVMFNCDPNKLVPGPLEPMSFSLHEPCRYDFQLSTAAACAVDKTETITHGTCGLIAGLDTSAISKQYTIQHDAHKYVLNFCGATGSQAKCNGTADFGVCQVLEDGTEVLAGKKKMNATILDEDKIIFNYTDGVICAHDPLKRPRNVELTILCGLQAGLDSKPEFISESVQDCTYSFYWHRPELCRKESVPCTASAGGHLYDLSPLSEAVFHANTESAELDSKYKEYDYTVSVCKPIPDESNPCPGAGICKVNPTDKSDHQDLGFLHEGPKVLGSDDHLELHYTSGIKCKSDPSKTMESIIVFTCGPHRGTPNLITTDGCTYQFQWMTQEACHDEGEIKPLKDCKATDLQSGQTIDLSKFGNEMFTFQPSKTSNDHYKLSICTPLTGGDCDGAAVCNNKDKLGLASTAQYRKHGDSVIVTYSGGMGCRLDGESKSSSTEIDFICNPSAGKGAPTLSQSSACKTEFRWETSFTCVSDCVFENNGYTHEFRDLDSHGDPISITGGDYSFMMSICNSMSTANDCGTETSICATAADGHKYPIGITNTQTAQSMGDNTIALEYQANEGEGICTNKNLKPHVRIILTCANKLGQPVFDREEKSNCTFFFKWSTHAACRSDDRNPVTLTEGIFTDPASKKSYSIKQAYDKVTKFTNEHFSFALSLNAYLAEKDDSAMSPGCTDGKTRVCQYEPAGSLKRPIGTEIKESFYGDEELQMKFKSDSQCGRYKSRNVETIINFRCNPEASNDSLPIAFQETESCQYVFEWEMPSLCNPVTPGSGGSGGKKGLSSGVVAIIVIIVLVSVIGTAGVVIYKVKKRRRWAGTYEYSGLSTDDDTSMLVNDRRGNSPRFYNDDDDELII